MAPCHPRGLGVFMTFKRHSTPASASSTFTPLWRGACLPSALENVVHLDFPTSFDVGSVFLRPQEFYESEFEDIRGSFFTWEAFMDRYATAKGGFTYFTDWGGFNLPDVTLRAFFERFGHDLTEKEQALKQQLEPWLAQEGRFYVIATCGGKPDLIRHEEAHALFYLNPSYQADQTENVSLLRPQSRENAIECLKDMGYHESVWDDEIQAYGATSTYQWLQSSWAWSRLEIQRFRDVFQNYKTPVKKKLSPGKNSVNKNVSKKSKARKA